MLDGGPVRNSEADPRAVSAANSRDGQTNGRMLETGVIKYSWEILYGKTAEAKI